MLQHTHSSALNNRIVTFINIDNDYKCVICLQVADDPVRCSGMCSGIFCSGCMQKALTRSNQCPLCKGEDTRALKDVVVRNQIMKHQVYCIHNDDIENTTDRKRKASSDEKCTWIGKYDQLNTHINQCNFEVVICSNEGCKEKMERRLLDSHGQSCIYRTKMCDLCHMEVKLPLFEQHGESQCPKTQVTCVCGFQCTRDLLEEHQGKDCPLTEIPCEIIGCGRKLIRGDYDKHQIDALHQHIRLLSSTVQRLVSAAVDPQPIQIKWRLTDIATKLREASASLKCYNSSIFEVLLRGSHKLYIQVRLLGNNELGLYLKKDVTISNDKSHLDIAGTSFTITKSNGLQIKKSLPSPTILQSPNWGQGWLSFLPDLTSYIDNDGINITLDLKLNKGNNEPVILK